jgi:hypothetical protein
MRKPAIWGLSLALLFTALGFYWQSTLASEKPIHEEQWIVDSIGRDIAEMVLFANMKAGKPEIKLDACDLQTKEISGAANKFDYQLKWSATTAPQEKEFELVDYAWSPDNYAPWAKQLIEQCALKVSAPAPTSSDDLLAVLSNYDGALIAKENRRVSSALTEHPLDPNWHEQAALLCALYGLRESAACFSDVRSALNRVSAHLSMAEALRGSTDYSDAGKVAQVAAMCLAEREAAAVVLIDKYSSGKNAPAMQSWLRALKVRATHDYRLADLEKAGLVERLEYGRALADDIGSDSLSDYLDKNKPDSQNVIDWLRIGMRGISTVESGHRYAEPSLQAEGADFAKDFQLYKNTSLKAGSGANAEPSQEPSRVSASTEANAELSLQPTRCLVLVPTPQLEAISWPSVAAFHSRHLLDSVFQRYYFEQTMWGVPEQAKQLSAYADKSFASIRLYPLCRLCLDWVDETKSNTESAASLMQLITNSPQDVSSDLWHRIGYLSSSPATIPSPYSWFAPRFPMGTAYDFSGRFSEGDPHLSDQELFDLLKLSPYNIRLIFNCTDLRAGGEDKVTGEQLAAACGTLADLDLSAMRDIADAYKNNPAKYVESLAKIARYKPDYYFKLGDQFVHYGQTEKAREAYENGVKLGRDSVFVSNSSGWLVNYYFDHGQKEKALELAKNAAEVYSHKGLMTLARLYERMNKLSDAEDYVKKASERYDLAYELCHFYMRHKNENERYKQEGEKVLKSVFPNGLVKLQSATLVGPPKIGVKIVSDSDETKKYQLKEGDIFVGIDGYAIENTKQFTFIRTMSSDPKIEVTAWTGTGYRVVKAELPDRLFYCKIKNFPISK